MKEFQMKIIWVHHPEFPVAHIAEHVFALRAPDENNMREIVHKKHGEWETGWARVSWAENLEEFKSYVNEVHSVILSGIESSWTK